MFSNTARFLHKLQNLIVIYETSAVNNSLQKLEWTLKKLWYP